ncbi:MAG: hypothetical protein QW212_03100 [Nitrososphaerales archaeon]
MPDPPTHPIIKPMIEFRRLIVEMLARGNVLVYDSYPFDDPKFRTGYFFRCYKHGKALLIEMGGVEETYFPRFDYIVAYLEDCEPIQEKPSEIEIAEALQFICEFRQYLHDTVFSRRLIKALQEAYIQEGIWGYYNTISAIFNLRRA